MNNTIVVEGIKYVVQSDAVTATILSGLLGIFFGIAIFYLMWARRDD